GVLRRYTGVSATNHRQGSRHHHEREQNEQDRTGNESARDTSSKRTDHARGAKDNAEFPPYSARPGMGDEAHRTGHSHDKERCGDGFARFYANHVGEDGNGEDRSAAAQKAQGYPDEHGERECDDEFGRHTYYRVSVMGSLPVM